jgi:MFS family permease
MSIGESSGSGSAAAEFRRGWRPLLASSLGNGAGLSGLAFYTFGVFVVPLVTAFGWQRGDVSTAASFLIFGTAITAPIVGGLIDRLGARRVGLTSMALLGVGYVALTQIEHAPMIGAFYAAWLTLSLIGGGTTPVVWTRTVNVWFDRGRGLALGLALAGSGLAGIFAPRLITGAIDRWGWQGGYLALAAFILFIALPLIAWLFDDQPRMSGAAAAEGAPAAPASATALPGLTLEQSLRGSAFWKIAIGFFFVSAAIAGLIINLVPLLIDRGLDKFEAADIAGIMGIAVLLGRIGIGWLLDRLSGPLVARVLLALCAIGCFALAFPGTPTWVIALCVVSLGLAAAAEVDLVAYLSSRYFGMRAYGRIYGFQLSAFYVGAALGPLAIGQSFNRTGSYELALQAAAAALLFGAIVIGTLGRAPKFSPEN